MLTTKRINLGISIASRVLRVVIILYSASIFANCIWWVLSPSGTNVFIQWADLDVHDKVTSYINNRYPFGIVVIPKAKEPEKPRVLDQLKLTGVYLNTNKDSFAFIEYQNKPMTVRTGGEIGSSGATVISVNADSIVINADGQEATVNVSSGGASSAGGGSSASGSFGGRNNNPDTMFGNRSNNNSSNDSENNSSGNSTNNQAAEDFKQQRRKVLEEFNARSNSGRRESSSDDDD
jgi:type II secretory pathway component PulC